jgi:hypothetical protein
VLREEPLQLAPADVAGLPPERLLRQCARRLASDAFLRAAGERLFAEYGFIAMLSRGLFGWLFRGGAAPPAFCF